MGLGITISVSGTTELNRVLAIKAGAIKDLRPAWDQIERALQAQQKRVFMNKGSDGGLTPWAKLSDSTKREKQRNYPRWVDYPLIRTQALMKAWTSKTGQAAVRVKEPLFFAYGIDEGQLPYAKYHQLGTSRMPAREHLRLPESMRVRIVKIIQAYLIRSGQFVRETLFG